MIRRNGSPRSHRLVRLSALATAVTASVLAFGIPASEAQNGCSGTGCLPTSGYTFDGTWNCGAIDSTAPTGDVCYYNGTKSYSSATQHTWSWGSADYDGGGSTYVCVEADASGGSSMFSSCGYNLARGCYFPGCSDQDSVSGRVYVLNYDGGHAHTIYGHAKA